MPRLELFFRLMVRPLFREPVRTALTVLAVALGVGVVLAIDLAGDAAAGSFHSSLETLAGDSNLEVTASGGIPQELVGKLAMLPYAIRVRPRIEDYATVVDSGETLPLIGLDLIAEANDHTANIDTSAGDAGDISKLNDPRSVWVGSRLHVKPGDTLKLLLNDETHDFVVQGVFDDSKEGGSAILMDIAAAQKALRKGGRVDRILIRAPDTPSLEEWQTRLAAALPAGIAISPQGSGTEENRKMLAAFRWNLRILSYVSLVVGAFLIYNTISVSVVRRRSEIGIVRALGATRATVMAAFLGEAAFFGVVGGLLGLPLGRVMASGAVRLLGATVDALYVSSRPGSIALTPGSVVATLFIGIGAAVISAISPAREAASVAPVEAMARGRREFLTRVHQWRDLGIALTLGIASAASSRVPAIGGKPLFGYLSAILLIAALVFAVPALVSGVGNASANLLQRILGVEALLASRSLVGSLRRTSVLVSALATAIAMMVSIGIMVGSFRQTVLIWMDDQLPADLYLRPAGDPASDRHPTISPTLADKIAALPGVKAIDRFRAYEVSFQNTPATLASADLSVMSKFRRSDFASGRPPDQVLAELKNADTVIVSEPFSNKHVVYAGDTIPLALGDHKASFRVVDVYYDYGSERGVIIMDRATMLRYLPDPTPSNLAVYVTPGFDLEAVRTEIERACIGSDILVASNRDLRTEAIRIFDQTFAITYALEVVAMVVAVIGIAGAMIAMVIDRRRELGLLRFLGASKGQVRRLILVEAGLIGLLSNFAGAFLGWLLSFVLIFVINKQSFGWTIQFHWPIEILIVALTGIYLATIAAGLYPARVAVGLNPIEVVHEE